MQMSDEEAKTLINQMYGLRLLDKKLEEIQVHIRSIRKFWKDWSDEYKRINGNSKTHRQNQKSVMEAD